MNIEHNSLNNEADSIRSRLLWRCRRGIREMDILLQQFMEQCYATLSADEIKTFDTFLNEADLDILAWIMGRSSPANPAYEKLVRQLQRLN